MPTSLRLHVVTRGEYESGADRARWEDPEGLLADHPARRQTLLDNPLAGDESQPARIVAVRRGVVMGKTDFLAGEILLNGQPRTMLWSSGTVVRSQHRGRGIGTRLAAEKRQLADFHGTCGASMMNQRVYQKLGWNGFSLPRYILLLRARPVVQRYLGAGPLAALSTLPAQAALSAGQLALRAIRPVRSRHLEARPAEHLDESFDSLLAPRVPVAIHRSSRWINWQLRHAFADDPRNRQNLYIVYDRRENLLGYFTTKVRFHQQASHRGFRDVLLGSLQDHRSFAPEQLSTLQIIDLAVKALRRQQCDAIEVCVRERGLAKSLRRFGFVPLGEQHLYFAAVDGSDRELEAHSPDEWEITAAEGDSFFT